MKQLLRRRLKLWTAQNGECYYCGRGMWVRGVHQAGQPGKMATIEHIVPPKLGGHKTNLKNLLCTCQSCNKTRGQIEHQKFIEIRKHKENWQVLAKEEQWRMQGIYTKKVFQRKITKLRHQYSVLHYFLKGVKRIQQFEKKYTWYFKQSVKPLIINIFKQFEYQSFKPLNL